MIEQVEESMWPGDDDPSTSLETCKCHDFYPPLPDFRVSDLGLRPRKKLKARE